MITVNSDGSPVSDAFAAAVASPIAAFDARLLVGGSDMGARVKSLSLSLGCSSDSSAMVLGSACSASATGIAYGCQPDIVGKELEVRIGVDVGGEFEYVTVAQLVVTYARTAAGWTSFQACGTISARMQNRALGLDAGRYAPSALASSIASASGVPVRLGGFAATGGTVPISGGESCRQALEQLALSLGGYAAESNDGSVIVSPLPESTSASLPETQLRPLPSLSDAGYALDGLTVVVPPPEGEEGGETYAFGSGRVVVTGSSYTRADAEVMWANMQGRRFSPGIVSLSVLDPRITPFDMLAVPFEGESRNVPAFGISATYDGGYFGSFTANGPTLAQEESATQGPLSQMMDNLVLKTAFIDRLVAYDLTADVLRAAVATVGQLDVDRMEADHADISDLKAEMADIANLDVDTLNAATATIQAMQADTAYVKALTGKALSAAELAAVEATVASLDAGSIAADAALLAGATIRALLAQSGWFDQLEVTGDASVTGRLTSVLLDGDTAKFANIYADALKLLGADGLYHALNVAGLGESDASAMVEAHGEALDSGLHGSRIIAESVTASQIDVTTLVAAMLLTQAVTVGNPDGFHVSITKDELGFYEGDSRVAYVNEKMLWIPFTVVLRAMQVGAAGEKSWQWRLQDDGNLTLAWTGPNMEE